MKSLLKIAFLSFMTAAAGPSAAEVLNGAGATFPYPIYSKWFDEYHKIKPDLQINYQSIGSGGGIRQITERTVDFGASDGPMTDKQLFKVDGKLLHIPTVLGAVVPVFNLKGVENLTLSGPTLAGIFLGTINRWNDPAVAKDNPGAALPEMGITVVRRSDGSGTTYCWTDYLSKVSPEWRKSVGTGTAVKWPAGLGGKGNEGVSGLVKQTPNSIGYVELIYAKQNGIAYAAVVNAAGKAVKADIASVTEAAAGVKMPADYRVSIVNSPAPKAYPISTFTWLLVYEKNPGGKGPLIRDFLSWMLAQGQKIAPELGYAALPPSVKAMVGKTIQSIK